MDVDDAPVRIETPTTAPTRGNMIMRKSKEVD
jgi:hypothetical protein